MPWLLLLFLTGCAGLVTVSPRTSVEAIIRGHLDERHPQSEPHFFHPVAGKSGVYSPFGDRAGNPRPHQGVDFISPTGNPIQAAASGQVIYAGEGIDRYGKTIILKHEGGYFSLYAHLSELLVEEGEQVIPGLAIARSGDTGNASGPHLHFEIRKGVKPLDPLKVAGHLK